MASPPRPSIERRARRLLKEFATLRRLERRAMVEHDIAARARIKGAVLDALERVPRHLFVDELDSPAAYDDHPLPIGHGQTISQPLIVALMTDALELEPTSRVLEIGTGSGYQTAVLSELVDAVWTVEIVPQLAARAEHILRELGHKDIHFRVADGALGWPSRAPFDAILAAAAPASVPAALVDQLAPGGRLCIPIGSAFEGQELMLFERQADGELVHESLGLVRFVPMTGPGSTR